MAIGKTPNFYQLSGGGLLVAYTTDGIRGQPGFTYQDRSQSRSFTRKDQIKAEETSIGTLVSVVLNITPDSGNTTFTLLVPKVALADTTGLAISTLGVTTIHRTSFLGPLIGQDDLYETTQLSGTASFVIT